jgi:hypothetical protein
MDINAILEMDPNSECEIHYDGTEDWKHCYFQYINESNADVDPNKLPLLDDEYLNDTGEPLLNDDNQEVYDPTQEIQYELYHELGYKQIYWSKTFIGLLQKKIKELIDSGELSDESDDYEVLEALETQRGRCCLEELFYSIGCNDIKCLEDSDDDSLLWFTSSQLDIEGGEIHIEEIKK